MTGPVNIQKLTSDQVNSLRIPKVFVPHLCEETHETRLKEYHFLVYHAIQSTLCLLIPHEVDFTVDFFKRLDGNLGPKLTNMSADLLDVFGRHVGMSNDKNGGTDAPPSILSPSICVTPNLTENSKASDEDFDLVYFNQANKAMKNTTSRSSVKSGKDDDIQHAIADLNENLGELMLNEVKSSNVRSKMTSELSMKMANEDWMVAKNVDQRQMYLAFKNKSSHSLLDISDEADKMMSTEFRNICLPP